MSIHYLKNSEIDINAWDKCISGSFNSNIFAFSWFLDLICDTWDALVEDEYRSIMPLTLRHFLGRDIINTPGLASELGIFSGSPISAEKTGQFINTIPDRFRYYRIALNKYNPVDESVIPCTIKKRFELDLIKPYYKMVVDFSPDLRRKLNLAAAKDLSLVKGLSPNDLIRFITDNSISMKKDLIANNFRLMRTVIAGLIRYTSGELFGIYNQHNDLASAGLFSFAKNHINLLFLLTAPEQLDDFPHLFLIDRFIDKYAETNTTLLFDYQDDPRTSLPCADFGARESNIVVITRNDLPFYLRWLPMSSDL